MNRVQKKKTIAFRLRFVIVMLVLLQSLLVAALLVSGGVLKQIKDNEYETFERVVNNRAVYLQGEMLNRFSNIDSYVEQVSSKLPLLKTMGKDRNTNVDTFFSAIEGQLVTMLQTTKATDCFVILNDDQPGTGQHSALYFRDEDPALNNPDDSDIFLLAGPAEFTKRYAALEDWWNYKLVLNSENDDFYEKPYGAAALGGDSALLGYWSPPFRLNDQDTPRVAYSRPLLDGEGTAYGVIGIALSDSYLNQYLPAAELAAKDSLGYMIGYQPGKNADIQPIIMGGAYQKRIIYEREPLELSVKKEKNQVYLLKNHKSNKEIYVCLKGLNLYQTNTPFDTEQWYVIGLQEENQLMNLRNRVEMILFYSIIGAILLGIVCGSIVSYQFTKPITVLSKKVRGCDPLDEIVLGKTGLLELDELAEAIENGNRMIAEAAKKLRQERDQDALTKLFGRRLFRSSVTSLLEQGDLCQAAMIMLDLDNFKQVNDEYGHAWGDTYLKETARKLKEMSSNGCIVGRRSGDEFYVFFYDFPNKDEIRTVLKDLYARLEKDPLEFPDGSKKVIRISAGIAWTEAGKTDYDELLACADRNLYKVKNNNKGTFGE